jgi:hypothetical protein
MFMPVPIISYSISTDFEAGPFKKIFYLKLYRSGVPNQGNWCWGDAEAKRLGTTATDEQNNYRTSKPTKKPLS